MKKIRVDAKPEVHAPGLRHSVHRRRPRTFTPPKPSAAMFSNAAKRRLGGNRRYPRRVNARLLTEVLERRGVVDANRDGMPLRAAMRLAKRLGK